MKDFVRGCRYLLSGFGLITKPGIRLYVIVPLFINIALFASVIIFGAHQINLLIDSIAAQWTWAEWITWLLWPIFVILALVIVFFCFSIVANLIGAPFNGMLSEAVEAHLTTQVNSSPTNFKEIPAEIMKALKSEARKFLYFLMWALPLLLLFLIPVFGQIAAPFIWFLFGAWMLSLEYLDYPQGNKGKTFPEIRQIAASKRPLMMGFGTAVMGLTLVPVFNFIAMPVAVAAATKLSLENLPET